MKYLNVTIGFDLMSENPMLVLTSEKEHFGVEMERVHGQHPYPMGKLNKEKIIQLRMFINEVLKDEKT